MDKLRLLEIHNACVPQGPKYLPDGLQWIDWENFPLESMPPRFQADNLVGLKLYRSCITQLWKGKKMLDKLKYIDLSHSSKLIRTPDLTETPNLETLNLDGCINLVEVHPSVGLLKRLVRLQLRGSSIIQLWEGKKMLDKLKYIDLAHSLKLIRTPDFTETKNLETLDLGFCCNLVEVHPSVGLLKRLVSLNLGFCKSLRILPKIIHLESLEVFILWSCCQLQKFPEIPENMRPLSIEHLPNLLVINLSSCENLARLPTTVYTLKRPEELGCLESLKKLYLGGTAITSLPSTICMLKRLEELFLNSCSKLEKLPEELGNLECLRKLYLDGTAITRLPSTICMLKRLEELFLRGCSKLEKLPEELGCLESLRKLYLIGTAIKELPSSIGHLTSLVELDLTDCKYLTSLPSTICMLKRLEELFLSGCSKLEKLPEELGCLRFVSFINCLQLLEDGQSNNISSIFWQRILQVGFSVTNTRLYMIGSKDLPIIILPGKDILEWFSSNQTVGSSILVKVPPNWLNNKFRGFGVCAVIESITEATTREGIKCVGVKFDAVTPSSTCEFSWDLDCDLLTRFKFKTLEIIGSQHVCLALVPIPPWKRTEYNSNLNDWCDVKFSIETNRLGVVVKKLGICLVYDDMKPNDVM